ncbi:MAG: MFS transporter [Clostridiales bacterium]|nr:MFS transporter [Clostridiales bacterium]
MAHFRFNLHHDEHITLGNIDQNRLKVGKLLIFACFFMYMTSMAVKGIFAAEIAYIQKLWTIGYAKTSMANTFYFVTYGAVQIGMFILMSKINLFKYLAFTVPLSAICAILMGTSTDIFQMWIYFGLTGAFQAGIFCGCNAVLTNNLPTSQLSSANRVMNLGYAMGTVVAYALCGLCISFDLWRIPYFVLGSIFLFAVIVFLAVSKYATRYKHINEIIDGQKLAKNQKAVDNDNDPLFTIETRKKKVLFYVLDLTLTFIITALYYCIMNNLTPLLANEHGLGQNVAIYVSILAPITISAGPMLLISACNKDRDFIRQGIKYMFIILPIPLILAFFYKVNVILALVLTIIFVVLTNGVKSIALSIITFKMRKHINSGAYSAISNAIASISAGVTPTLIGSVIDYNGWKVAYLVTFAIALILTITLIVIDVCVRKVDKLRHQNQQKN